ncbi:hypothetical protein GTQ99_02160 [Kineococcus sp. T13]|uniref:hypothetical protein n=1 Tax=Kineococcus vitellinus TaxID=2696565 RepID=UPI0014122D6C|nr:hypothetical protein [Kineococcus vitellinus]NAZ74233.1 hypothetical protein [Kineococcus vitellinus]
MRIVVDRDSVAMGDDVEPHRRIVEVPDDAPLEEVLRRTAPDVSVSGGSTWITTWNGVPVAVHSSRWGTGRVWDERYRTLADLPPGEGTPVLFHRYWAQVDADWLLERLRAGEPLDRGTLERQWAPLAEQRREHALRERERTHPGRLLDTATVAALTALGARVEVHTDRVCRFTVEPAGGPGAAWRAELHDTMTLVWTPAGRCGSVRPTALAQPWLVALVGAAVSGRGADALPAPAVASDVRRSPSLWTVTRTVDGRQELAQLPDEEHAQWFRRTLGRSVQEVAAAYADVPERPRGLGRWLRRRR